MQPVTFILYCCSCSAYYGFLSISPSFIIESLSRYRFIIRPSILIIIITTKELQLHCIHYNIIYLKDLCARRCCRNDIIKCSSPMPGVLYVQCMCLHSRVYRLNVDFNSLTVGDRVRLKVNTEKYKHFNTMSSYYYH